MKCKVKAGELREALQMANITVDKRAGSELGYVYIGAKKGKGSNQRILLHSTDSIMRTLIRVNCEVEEAGELIVDPVRISAILDRRTEEDVVSFSQEGKNNRTVLRVGGARSALSSNGKVSTWEPALSLFPFNDVPLFRIEAGSLKSLLDRTQAFIYRKDGNEGLKNVLIRAVPKGYEAVSTNREVVAKATVADPNSPIVEEGKPYPSLEVPGRALASLSRLLNRNKKEIIRIIVTQVDGKPNWVYFRTEDVFFGTGLSAAKLPAVDAVFQLQHMDTTIELPRGIFLDSLHRSDPFGQDTNLGHLVQVEVKESSVCLSAEDAAGDFEEEVPAVGKATGGSKGTFQVGYFADALRTAHDENVTLKLGTIGPNKRPSAVLLADTPNQATYVVGAVG